MAVAQALDPVFNRLRGIKRFIGEKIFGHNNERLDLIMDSFNKLTPKKRSLTVAALIALVVFMVISIFFVYFYQLSSLKGQLSERKNAVNKLAILGKSFGVETAKFDDMVSGIKRKISGLRVKAELEKLANGVGVDIDDIDAPASPKSYDGDNPLSKHFKQHDHEVRISKISIPELLDFLVAIEKADRLFQVSDLRISGLYKTKLHFEAMFKVQAIVRSDS